MDMGFFLFPGFVLVWFGMAHHPSHSTYPSEKGERNPKKKQLCCKDRGYSSTEERRRFGSVPFRLFIDKRTCLEYSCSEIHCGDWCQYARGDVSGVVDDGH